MLDETVVRAIAFVMAAGTAVGLAMFSRRGHACGGRHRSVRARDNPPELLQVVWPVVNLVPQVYPFAVVAAPGLAYTAAPRFAFPFDSAAQVVGFLAWGAGGLLVLWSGRALGRFMVLEIAVSEDHELITRGPYRWIRHPTYAGVMAMAVGASLAFLSYVLAAFAVLTIAIAVYRSGKEERLLASESGFGETYREYARRTGRFLPPLGPRRRAP